MTAWRSVTSRSIIVAAATLIILAPGGATPAGVRPPTCGTPNTPPCVLNVGPPAVVAGEAPPPVGDDPIRRA